MGFGVMTSQAAEAQRLDTTLFNENIMLTVL